VRFAAVAETQSRAGRQLTVTSDAASLRTSREALFRGLSTNRHE